MDMTRKINSINQLEDEVKDLVGEQDGLYKNDFLNPFTL